MTSERIKKGCRMSLAHGQPFRVFLQQLLSGTDYKRFETCMEAASRDFSERQPPALLFSGVCDLPLHPVVCSAGAAVMQLSGFCFGSLCAGSLGFRSRIADHRSLRYGRDTGSVAERDLPEVRPDAVILDGFEEGVDELDTV